MKPETQVKLISLSSSALTLAIIVVFFLMMYPFKVIQIDKIEVLTPKVKAGSQVRIKLTGYKYFAVPADAQRKLVNHFEYFLARETVNDLTTGYFEKEMSTPIPGYAEPGVYHVHNDLVHEIFSFRKIFTHWESPTFEVYK